MNGNFFWCLFTLCWLNVSLGADAGQLPDCLDVPKDKMARMKDLVVKEDVHDKLVGDFSELWISKERLDEGTHHCVKYTRSKVDDRVIAQSLFVGKGYANRNSSIEKVENGIYLLKMPGDDKMAAKLYIIYASDRAVAYFACNVMTVSGVSKVPVRTRVTVHSQDLKTPLGPETQAAVDLAVQRVRDHQELLGELSLNPHAC